MDIKWIASMVLPTAIGVWGVIVALRSRQRAQITVLHLPSIALFRDIVRDMPSLSVFYMGEPVPERIALFRGIIANTGKLDLDPNAAEGPLCLDLQDRSRWLEAEIVEHAKGVNARINTDSTRLTLSTGILRPLEYVAFKALVALPNEEGKEATAAMEDSVASRLTSVWRVTGFRNPEITKAPSHRYRALSDFLFGGFLLVLGLFVIVMTFLSPPRQSASERLVYQVSSDNGSPSLVQIAKIDDNQVTIVDSTSGDAETVNFGEFAELITGRVFLAGNDRPKGALALSILFGVAMLAAGTLMLVLAKKNTNRLRKWRSVVLSLEQR